MRRMLAIVLLVLSGCPTTVPTASDAAPTEDAPPRWRPCPGCRIECGSTARIEIVPVTPADPFDPVPDCTGCRALCSSPPSEADEGPHCVPYSGVGLPIYDPSCDGVHTLTEGGRMRVWRDTWR